MVDTSQNNPDTAGRHLPYPNVCPHTNEAPNDPPRGMNPLPVEDALLIIPFQNWSEANNIRTSTTLHFQ